MPDSLPDALLSGLSGFVAARLGLHFPQERWPDLARGVAAAGAFGKPDGESCARWLLSAPLAQKHIEVLAAHLTVGESYFFREKRSLEIFEEHIVPELLRERRAGERHLRIWSAGCAAGEEPYSIAMLLDRLVPAHEQWHVTILATDINPQSLRKAEQGVYGKWSFRGVPDWIKARHFKKREGGRFELSPHIRKKVTFSYLNLSDDVYPSFLNNTNAMDVIFCRNVLMYFTPEKAGEVAAKLALSLAEGGWLIVSPAETGNALFSPLAAVAFPEAVLYRKVAAAAPLPAIPEMETPQPPGAAAPDPERAPLPAQEARADFGQSLFATARHHANQGRLGAALEWCEKAIAVDRQNPAFHYLHAAVQQELGRDDAAAQALTRALYLDSGFALAHFALANVRLSQGRRREADRHFSNALALMRARPHEEIIPESGGLAAGRLAEIIASVMAAHA
ncbi:MAG: chemotaxis protein CheR [Nitrosomonadales bacterium]|nr:chemotaxis protein CheR [Nitrosomonadales bacterium]